MGNTTLIYREKFHIILRESFLHLSRLNDAFGEFEKKFTFPLDSCQFRILVKNIQDLAFADQVIYRFSKLQDIMGAKLFKSYLLAQGENVDKPFIDILNQLEKLDILMVDDWFEFRDIRNNISHNYEENEGVAIDLLNIIYTVKDDLANVLNAFNVEGH